MRAVDTNVLVRLVTRDDVKQLMVEVARKAGHAPLGTFDRDLGKIDGAQRL